MKKENVILYDLFERVDRQIKYKKLSVYDYGYLTPEKIGIRSEEDKIKSGLNYAFLVETYQSGGENVYFRAYFQEYGETEKFYIGDFYIKNCIGYFSKDDAPVFFELMHAGTEITKEIFWEQYNF